MPQAPLLGGLLLRSPASHRARKGRRHACVAFGPGGHEGSKIAGCRGVVLRSSMQQSIGPR